MGFLTLGFREPGLGVLVLGRPWRWIWALEAERSTGAMGQSALLSSLNSEGQEQTSGDAAAAWGGAGLRRRSRWAEEADPGSEVGRGQVWPPKVHSGRIRASPAGNIFGCREKESSERERHGEEEEGRRDWPGSGARRRWLKVAADEEPLRRRLYYRGDRGSPVRERDRKEATEKRCGDLLVLGNSDENELQKAAL